MIASLLQSAPSWGVLERWVSGRVLTARQKQAYQRDGYLKFDASIPAEILDRVTSDLMSHFQRTQPGTPGYPLTGRIPDAFRFSSAVKQVVLFPRILQALEELYGRKPLPFQTLNFPVGTEQTVHSDTIHFNSQPAGWMCGVWLALEDIGPDCGPLVYYPGSHMLPEYTLQDVGVPAIPESYENYHHYEKFIADLIQEQGLQPHYATLRKGEALIWSANLLHGGSKRHDINRSRHSQVTHYFFEGCQYYTPMWSTPQQTYWRQPEWIV
jgi:hypothetical protein